MKDLVDATIRYLQRQGKNAEIVSSRRPPTKLRVQGHQVKIEPLEDPRGVSRRVRVHVFDTAGGRGGPKLGSRDVTKSGKEIADAIIGILNRRVSESQLRQIVREGIKKEMDESQGDSDWFYISRLLYDLDQNRREIKNIGQKEVGGETVHEFALNDKVFEIRKVQ